MNYFTMYVFLIFLVKIIFIILALYEKVLKNDGKKNQVKEAKITYWKERVEFVFIILMSLLLIYIFFPHANNRMNLINSEVKLLLFLFGFVLIITAKWSIFINESKWFQELQNVLGRRE